MKQYHELISNILTDGRLRTDRTGVGTISIFGTQTRYPLLNSFPLVTTKFTSLKLVILELLWFLRGDTNNNILKQQGCNIWNEWALPDGELGPVYGAMWRSWPNIYVENGDTIDGTQYISNGWNEPIDQFKILIDGLKNKPFSRRHIISGWNPALLPDETKSHAENVSNGKQALPPCHTLFQFYVVELTYFERKDLCRNDIANHANYVNAMTQFTFTDDIAQNHNIDMEIFDKIGIPKFGLQCQLYQRSADTMLGKMNAPSQSDLCR